VAPNREIARTSQAISGFAALKFSAEWFGHPLKNREMETALADPTDTKTRLSGLGTLPVKQILMLLAGILALVGIVVASIHWARTPDYKVLFANLSDRDGGAVMASLSQMNVPYRFAEGGGAILVPGNLVHEARLKLASQGIPKGGTVGFELMETQRFGVTQFQERLNFQRGLEGELARSIQALAAVQNARVHLALPTQNGFMREQQKPSASVLLALHPGRTLDRAQVAGIVHLVASSVPELSPKEVSVIDQTGALLSQNGESQSLGLDPGQLNYIRQIESGYIQRIVDILEPILGRENVRAQVTADVDFTQTESTAELYKPNQGNEPAAVRSQQMSESTERAGAGGPQGIPGAMTNQPPGAATAPVNAPAQTPQAAGQQGAAGASGNTRKDAVTNFEVDKTVRVTRMGSGQIKRLTAAVVVNHRKTVAPDGKVTWTPLAQAEIENINALVREAVGFAKDRGDSINVVNAPFSREEAAKEPELPLWKQPFALDIAKDGARWLGLLVIAMLVIFAVIRPALKALAPKPPPAPPAVEKEQNRLSTTVENEVALPAPPGVTDQATAVNRQEEIMKLAKDNPATVANVVRNWVNNES